MKLTITAEASHPVHAENMSPAEQVAMMLAAIGFTRSSSAPVAQPLPMPEPSVLSVSDEPKAAAQPMPSVLDERSAQEHVKRERGKPSPGRKRRTAEELAEDEAAAETTAETAEIVHEVASVAKIRYFVHPESGSAWTTEDGSDGTKGTRDGLVEEVSEDEYVRFVTTEAEPAAISTGDTRVGPEDEPEEDQIQDIADEHAEVAATAVPDAPATLEDVRSALGGYSQVYGMPAVQTDGQVIVKEVLGEPPAGVPVWKMTAFPDDKYGAIVAAFKAATESNRFGREKV